jgi:hypothetical protein
MAHPPSTEDARAIDLINSSGVLNPNLTLDKLMDVTRQLAELEPQPDGVKELAWMAFVGSMYVYKISNK